MDTYSDYLTTLSTRFWAYLLQTYPDWEQLIEHPEEETTKRPVFTKEEASRNVIFNPAASEEERIALLGSIPVGERHKWYRSMNSSQALAQSVLGNLAIYDGLGILADLPADDGDTVFGNAQISSATFALEVKVGHLGERRPTSLDGYFTGAYPVAIECKFTEKEVGPCSRPGMSPDEPAYPKEHCDGNYCRQLNREDRCPLPSLGVKYWSYLPGLFTWDTERDLLPCPLYRNYQLVRNILAVGVLKEEGIEQHTGHALLIYDERNPAFQPGGSGFSSYTDVRAALRNPQMLRKCSWQRIVRRLRDQEAFGWLTDQLFAKYGIE